MKKYEFGNLFYDESYQDDAMLMRYALNELAEHLGHSVENPISLYMLCLTFMIPMKVCDAIFIDIAKLYNTGDKGRFKDLDFIKKEIFMKHFPDAKQFTPIIVEAFLKAFAKSRFPDLIAYI